VLDLPENVGIPAGRNAGIPEVKGDLLHFLDDDAYLGGDDFLACAAPCSSGNPTSECCTRAYWIPTNTGRPAGSFPGCGSALFAALWEGACVAWRSVGAWSALGRTSSSTCTKGSTSPGV